MEQLQDEVRALFTVDAVVFGTDASILDLELCNGFSFVRKSLMPSVDHLDKIFDTNTMGLRRDYESARIDESLDVVCVTKCVELDIKPSEADDYFQKMADESLVSLDNQIRAIRLLVECPLRCKKIMFRLIYESYTYQHLFHVNEAMATCEISKFHCSKDDCKVLCRKISEIVFPLSDVVLNTCHMHYDLSYHMNKHISMTLLVAVLEMMYIESELGKKEKLAKRCSTFLFANRGHVLLCYEKLKSIYKKRSEFVHEGKFQEITDDDVLFLRKCVRDSLLKIENEKTTKKERIRNLRRIIEDFGDWEPS